MIIQMNNEAFEDDTVPTPPIYDLAEAFKDDADTVRGAVVRDRIDNDWSWVVLSRDPAGKFRAIDMEVSFPSREKAREELLAAMKRLVRPLKHPELGN